MNTEEILSKCRKLSRLSTSSNSNEAALAASRLAELMVKYQIEQIDLDEQQSDKNNHVDSHLFYSSNRKSHWRMSIASGCARLFNCISYWSGSNIRLIGREDDVALCNYLFKSITEQIESLCSSEWAKYWLETCLFDDDDELEGTEPIDEDDPPCTCLDGYDPECAWEGHLDGHRAPRMKPRKPPEQPLEHRRAWSQSFLLACSSTVKGRLLAKHKAMTSGLPQTSTALVVFKNRYKDSLKYAKSMKWSKAKLTGPVSSSVYGLIQGTEAGTKVRIDKELTHNLPLLKG